MNALRAAAYPSGRIVRSFRFSQISKLSTTSACMGEGDTGAPRGAAQGDAFTKREQASEDYEIRKREMDKLQALKQKIADHQKHLEDLKKSVDDQISGSQK